MSGLIEGYSDVSFLTSYDSLDAALKSGDMESILLTLGVERVKQLDGAVKGKIEELQANNEELRKLNALSAIFAGAKDENGEVITTDPAEIQLLADYCKDNPDLLTKIHGGINCYDSSGNSITLSGNVPWENVKSIKVEHWDGNTLATVKAEIDNRIDALTSNDQLEMVELNSMVSKQTNAYELLTTVLSKFQEVMSSILSKMGR